MRSLMIGKGIDSPDVRCGPDGEDLGGIGVRCREDPLGHARQGPDRQGIQNTH